MIFFGLALFLALGLSPVSKSSLPSSEDKKLKICERQEEGESFHFIAETLLLVPRKLAAKLSWSLMEMG